MDCLALGGCSVTILEVTYRAEDGRRITQRINNVRDDLDASSIQEFLAYFAITDIKSWRYIDRLSGLWYDSRARAGLKLLFNSLTILSMPRMTLK